MWTLQYAFPQHVSLKEGTMGDECPRLTPEDSSKSRSQGLFVTWLMLRLKGAKQLIRIKDCVRVSCHQCGVPE